MLRKPQVGSTQEGKEVHPETIVLFIPRTLRRIVTYLSRGGMMSVQLETYL